jgi:hypothetical protein
MFCYLNGIFHDIIMQGGLALPLSDHFTLTHVRFQVSTVSFFFTQPSPQPTHSLPSLPLTFPLSFELKSIREELCALLEARRNTPKAFSE